jgi:hypothetical protein
MEYDVMWISPSGDLIDVKTSHIDYVVDNCKDFNLDLKEVKQIYKKNRERLGTEGKSRDEIINRLISNGWIRGRYQGQRYFEVSGESIKYVKNNKGFKDWIAYQEDQGKRDVFIIMYSNSDNYDYRGTIGDVFEEIFPMTKVNYEDAPPLLAERIWGPTDGWWGEDETGSGFRFAHELGIYEDIYFFCFSAPRSKSAVEVDKDKLKLKFVALVCFFEDGSWWHTTEVKDEDLDNVLRKLMGVKISFYNKDWAIKEFKMTERNIGNPINYVEESFIGSLSKIDGKTWCGAILH